MKAHPENLNQTNNLRVQRIGLDTHDQPVIITHRDCSLCRSEGFSAHARVRIGNGMRTVIATLYQVDSDWLKPGEAALSESAWRLLNISEGDEIHLSHPQPLDSLGKVRGRLYGQPISRQAMSDIITDIAAGRYADIHTAMFLTAMAARGLSDEELVSLTEAMISAGDRLQWPHSPITDKHCVGGLPGNRTTPLVVAIAAANGLWMPKTSSRAITSPAGTADTMETLTPVDLSLAAMRRVVQLEGACMVWGGAVRLSPVDDMLIRVARVMDLDAEGQLIASVMSKKIAAGATHLVLDLPVGDTAKVRSRDDAEHLSKKLEMVADAFELKTRILITDGRQPVGRGIGPALEAFDILGVLENRSDAPADLRQRSVDLAGAALELAGAASQDQGRTLAEETLTSGAALKKFFAICQAQGGLREPPRARQTLDVCAESDGQVAAFDNRRLGRVAKLAGAPGAPAAGVVRHVALGDSITRGQPLYTIHADSRGELNYAHEFAMSNRDLIGIHFVPELKS